MADSKYYYELYKTEKRKVKNYEDNIEDLEKIRNSLVNDMYDEIRKINQELDALKEDLNKGVRHNAAFTRTANDFSSKKEKAVTADATLSVCVSELNDEISSLTNKKNTAVGNRDYYERKCKDKLEEEGKPSWYYWF